jgi:hypothetical protein
MASLATIESELNSIPAEFRPAFLRIFRSLVPDLRFGHPSGDQPDPCVNFGAGFFSGLTASTAGDEFTIRHTFGRTPYLLVPVLPLDAAGAQLVPLTVSRVADDKRIYLTSTAEDATFTVMVEG